MLQRFPVIVGPTAGGKSALAVDLAEALDRAGLGAGEVVTADSMQVYRGMDIGTAKPTASERRGVMHHLIDILDPRESFSVDEWLKRAEATIADIRSRGRTPIVVGGSHLFIKALLEGLFDGPARDEDLRRELGALEQDELRRRLEQVDPRAADKIHANDRRRTVRALEVHGLTGKPISEHQAQWDRGRARADAMLVGLLWGTQETNRRVNARVREMVERGLVEEARRLWAEGRFGTQSREALGYAQLFDAFQGRCTVEEAVERIKIETRRLAKNQRTWLRRLRAIPGSLWVEVETLDPDSWRQLVIERILAALVQEPPGLVEGSRNRP